MLVRVGLVYKKSWNLVIDILDPQVGIFTGLVMLFWLFTVI